MIQAWLESIWAASLRGGAALLIAWALCLLPRLPAAVRCWIWRAAYAVLLISFAWTRPINLSLLRPQIAPAPSSPAGFQIPNRIVPNSSERPVAAPFQDQQIALSMPVGRNALGLPHGPSWARIAFGLWAAFLAIYGGRLALRWWSAARLRRGTAVEVNELSGLCRQMGIRRLPPVRIHAATLGPMLLGWWKPTIVLPESLLGSTHLRLILAHELAHLRRGDLLWNWMPTLALATLPLHPLVWICNRYWRLSSEAACDAEALSVTAAAPADYGRVLVHVALTRQSSALGVLAVTVAAESRWLLERRLNAMANIIHWDRKRLFVAATIVSFITLAAAVPWRAVAQTRPGAMGPAPQKSRTAPATAPANSSPRKALNAAALGSISSPAARIRSLASGTVEKVNVADGQKVKQGDLIVQLDSTQQARAVDSAAAILKASQNRLEFVEQQQKVGLATPADLAQATLEVAKDKDALEQRQDVLSQARIVAPFDGVIGELKVTPGSTILPGDAIAAVFDTTKPMVAFTVGSDWAPALTPGMPIEIRSPRDNSRLGEGQLTSGGPEVNPNTGMMTFNARVTSEAHPLYPGEFVNVMFHPNR